MKKLVAKLQRDFPQFTFVTGDIAHWSPEKQEITYNSTNEAHAVWTLLHELCHGILGHQRYSSDANLIQKEAAAWQQAQKLASQYGITIDIDHIEDCLDTYRDWLHKRSTCPECSSQGIQRTSELYSCFNCQTTWKVTESRFCRTYRLKKAQDAK